MILCEKKSTLHISDLSKPLRLRMQIWFIVFFFSEINDIGQIKFKKSYSYLEKRRMRALYKKEPRSSNIIHGLSIFLNSKCMDEIKRKKNMTGFLLKDSQADKIHFHNISFALKVCLQYNQQYLPCDAMPLPFFFYSCSIGLHTPGNTTNTLPWVMGLASRAMSQTRK